MAIFGIFAFFFYFVLFLQYYAIYMLFFSYYNYSTFSCSNSALGFSTYPRSSFLMVTSRQPDNFPERIPRKIFLFSLSPSPAFAPRPFSHSSSVSLSPSHFLLFHQLPISSSAFFKSILLLSSPIRPFPLLLYKNVRPLL